MPVVILKPCPFCGSTNLVIPQGAPEYWVLCDDCNASTEACTLQETAVKRWNRRADIKEEKILQHTTGKGMQ